MLVSVWSTRLPTHCWWEVQPIIGAWVTTKGEKVWRFQGFFIENKLKEDYHHVSVKIWPLTFSFTCHPSLPQSWTKYSLILLFKNLLYVIILLSNEVKNSSPDTYFWLSWDLEYIYFQNTLLIFLLQYGYNILHLAYVCLYSPLGC